jgi:hypothetical protein
MQKITMWDLLHIKEQSGIELTESLAMLPAASVSGLYFGNKCAQYFAVGKVTQEQVGDKAVQHASWFLSSFLCIDDPSIPLPPSFAGGGLRHAEEDGREGSGAVARADSGLRALNTKLDKSSPVSSGPISFSFFHGLFLISHGQIIFDMKALPRNMLVSGSSSGPLHLPDGEPSACTWRGRSLRCRPCTNSAT